MQHCRGEALKAVEIAAVPTSEEEFRAQVNTAVDIALHNVMDLLEGFWPTQAGANHRVSYALSVCIGDTSDVSSISEHERGPLGAGCILLDEFLRRIEHRRDVNIVVFLVVLEQQILDRADIERRRRARGDVIFDRDRASRREGKVRSHRKRRDDKGGDQ